jgi:hypothetical protein
MEDRLSDDQREKIMAEYGDVEKFRKEAEEVIYEEDGKTGYRGVRGR